MMANVFIVLANVFMLIFLLSAACLDSVVWVPFFLICIVSLALCAGFAKAAEWAEDNDR